MLSTAGSTTPPPSPRDQAPLPFWPALRGRPIPQELLQDRAWLDPPPRGRWAAALRRLRGRGPRPATTAAARPTPTTPATTARPAAASAASAAGAAEQVDHPTQEAA